MTYRFLGTHSDAGPIALRFFGQQIQMDDATAKDAVLGGCAIIPESDFQACGFTAEELRAYANPGPRSAAPSEFQSKVKAALVKHHDWRTMLESTEEEVS